MSRWSTKKRYAFSVGTRPAEVCGCTRYPWSSRFANSLRIVAEETSTACEAATRSDPTGCAVWMYSSTTALRIAAFRSSNTVLMLAVGPRSSGARLRDLDNHHRTQSPSLRAETKASWGTSTRPMDFIFFLPSFCFSSSFLLRVMSPP